MLILDLNESTDQVAMVNNVHWSGNELRREDGHVLRRALDLEVEGQRKKGRLKRTWKKQVEEESVMAGLRRKYVLCRLKWIFRIYQIATRLRQIRPPTHVTDTTGF